MSDSEPHGEAVERGDAEAPEDRDGGGRGGDPAGEGDASPTEAAGTSPFSLAHPPPRGLVVALGPRLTGSGRHHLRRERRRVIAGAGALALAPVAGYWLLAPAFGAHATGSGLILVVIVTSAAFSAALVVAMCLTRRGQDARLYGGGGLPSLWDGVVLGLPWLLRRLSILLSRWTHPEQAEMLAELAVWLLLVTGEGVRLADIPIVDEDDLRDAVRLLAAAGLIAVARDENGEIALTPTGEGREFLQGA